MGLETEMTIMIALLPFIAVWGLLYVTSAVERRRQHRVGRQIALTDAIHRELGAVAAPEVRRTWTGEWVVSVRLALSREHTVGTIARITGDLFRRLDGRDAPRVRLVLRPLDERVRRVGAESSRASGRLSRAA
jgi:hypothetical protein